MDQLTRDKIQMFFNNLNLAHEMARKDLGHLRACLRDAYDDGVLNRNPAGGRIRVVADPKKTKSDTENSWQSRILEKHKVSYWNTIIV